MEPLLSTRKMPVRLSERQKLKKDLIEQIEALSARIIEKLEMAMDVVNRVSVHELELIMDDLRAMEVREACLKNELSKYK